jgi:p24 family protein beta-1
MDGPKLMILQP